MYLLKLSSEVSKVTHNFPYIKGWSCAKKPRLWPALAVQSFALFAQGLRPIPAFNVACEKIERISRPLSFIIFHKLILVSKPQSPERKP